MQRYERMLKIKWTLKVTNEKVLERIKAKSEISKTIVKKGVRMIKHNLRQPVMLALILERMIEGKTRKEDKE